MSTSTPTHRRWFQFGLAAMFVVVTALALWIAYYVHWKGERREVRAWIDANGVDPLGAIGYYREGRQGLPWGLWLLGDKPVSFIRTTHDLSVQDETHAPPEHKWLVDRVRRLFPEADVYDDGELMFPD